MEAIADFRTMPENSLLLPIRVLPLIACPVTRMSCGGFPILEHDLLLNARTKTAFLRLFVSIHAVLVYHG